MTSSARAEGAPRPTSKLGLGGRVLLAGLIMTTAVPAGVALGFVVTEAVWARAISVVLPLLFGGAVANTLLETDGVGSDLMTAPFLAGLLTAAWPGTQLGVALHQLRGGHVEGIPVSELASHLDAASYTFTDALTLPAYRSEVVSTSLQGDPDHPEVMEHHYAVVPLVARDWQQGQPIPAWLIDDAGGSGPELTALRVRGRGEHWDAIEQALERHGLQSLDDAPLLRVGAVPLDGVYASIRWHGGVWGVLFVLWLVPTALWLRGQPSTRG